MKTMNALHDLCCIGVSPRSAPSIQKYVSGGLADPENKRYPPTPYTDDPLSDYERSDDILHASYISALPYRMHETIV